MTVLQRLGKLTGFIQKTRPKGAALLGTNPLVKCGRCITKVVEGKQGYITFTKILR
jgi:hypothetical protein